MSGITKGPWEKDRYGAIFGPNGERVLFEGMSMSGLSTPTTRANRDLVCAAPDLLSAAERVLAKLDHPEYFVTSMDTEILRAAITKARNYIALPLTRSAIAAASQEEEEK